MKKKCSIYSFTSHLTLPLLTKERARQAKAMKIIIKSKNLELTEALKDYAAEKIGNLERYWDEILEARVELEGSHHHHKGFFRCEVNLDVPQKHVLRAESTLPDLYAAIDEVERKLREEIEKIKGRQRAQDRNFKRSLKSIFAWRPWRRE